MKILHVVRQFEPSVGGLEAYVKTLCLYQQARGHICEVLTLNKIFNGQHGKLSSSQTIDGITIRRIGFIGHRRFFVPLVTPSYFRRFDVIHVHNTDVLFDYVAAIRTHIKVPIFATTHGFFFHTGNPKGMKNLYFDLITRRSARAFSGIFALSQNDFDLFEGVMPKFVLQPSAIVPIGSFICEGEDLIYVGRLASHKNIDRLIQTFAHLKLEHHIPGKLHIVGPSRDVTQDALAEKAQSLGVSDYAVLHDFVDSDRLREILVNCGYFVSGSSYEGFGMSMLEAMSVGLIPFVQPNKSFQELIALGGIGALIDYRHPRAAAAKIAELTRSVSLDDRKSSQAFAASFFWDKLIERILEAYAAELGGLSAASAGCPDDGTRTCMPQCG